MGARTRRRVVDGEAEHCQVASLALELKLGPDRPDVLWARVFANQLALVPRDTLGRDQAADFLVLHGHSPLVPRMTSIAHVPEDRHRRGLLLDFSLAENTILGVHYRKPAVSSGGILLDQKGIQRRG